MCKGVSIWILFEFWNIPFLQVQEQLDVLNEKLQERLKQQAEKQRTATEVKARLAEKVAHKVRQIHADVTVFEHTCTCIKKWFL